MISVFAVAGCAVQSSDQDDDDTAAEASELGSAKLSLTPGGASTYTLNAPSATDLIVSISCPVSSNPEVQGTVFHVSAPSLGATAASDEARSGLWSWEGHVPAGAHTITVHNQGPKASCTVKTQKASAGSCKSFKAWGSPNTDHTHINVGSSSPNWEELPASGDHWGAWAAWTHAYDQPVKRGFFLHNLEHGGLVFSYKCASATASASCADAKSKLMSVVNALGLSRVIVTPDPSQPEMFAVRGWRYAFSSSCFDAASIKTFAKAHYRHGREDEDSNPPIPYDPTTTNVPCNDLMSAPDSCN